LAERQFLFDCYCRQATPAQRQMGDVADFPKAIRRGLTVAFAHFLGRRLQ
jgi:hypothetical protein